MSTTKEIHNNIIDSSNFTEFEYIPYSVINEEMDYLTGAPANVFAICINTTKNIELPEASPKQKPNPPLSSKRNNFFLRSKKVPLRSKNTPPPSIKPLFPNGLPKATPPPTARPLFPNGLPKATPPPTTRSSFPGKLHKPTPPPGIKPVFPIKKHKNSQLDTFVDAGKFISMYYLKKSEYQLQNTGEFMLDFADYIYEITGLKGFINGEVENIGDIIKFSRSITGSIEGNRIIIESPNLKVTIKATGSIGAHWEAPDNSPFSAMTKVFINKATMRSEYNEYNDKVMKAFTAKGFKLIKDKSFTGEYEMKLYNSLIDKEFTVVLSETVEPGKIVLKGEEKINDEYKLNEKGRSLHRIDWNGALEVKIEIKIDRRNFRQGPALEPIPVRILEQIPGYSCNVVLNPNATVTNVKQFEEPGFRMPRNTINIRDFGNYLVKITSAKTYGDDLGMFLTACYIDAQIFSFGRAGTAIKAGISSAAAVDAFSTAYRNLVPKLVSKFAIP